MFGEFCKSCNREEVSGIHELHNDIVYYSTCEFYTQPLQDNMVFRHKTSDMVYSKIMYNAVHSFT